MSNDLRSPCPIAASLDLLGDRWTLVVMRDVLLAGSHSFTELGAQEGIATNVLTERLERLLRANLIERRRDPRDGRRRIYLPTERGIALIPVLVDLIVWGDTHTAAQGQKELAEALQSDRESVIEHLATRAREGFAKHGI